MCPVTHHQTIAVSLLVTSCSPIRISNAEKLTFDFSRENAAVFSRSIQNAYQCQVYGIPGYLTSGPSEFELNLAGKDNGYGLQLDGAR